MYGNKDVMGKNIARYLEQKGITQRELAEVIDVAPATVNQYIKAVTYPRIDKIERMARYFGCTKADLIEDENEVTHVYELTNEEYMMLCFWRQADDETRRMVARLLAYSDKFMEKKNA